MAQQAVSRLQPSPIDITTDPMKGAKVAKWPARRIVHTIKAAGRAIGKTSTPSPDTKAPGETADARRAREFAEGTGYWDVNENWVGIVDAYSSVPPPAPPPAVPDQRWPWITVTQMPRRRPTVGAVSGADHDASIVSDRLLQERIVYLSTEIDDTVADRIVAQLVHLDAVDPSADISFYINSPGGSIRAALAILDTMNFIRADVATHNLGWAAGTAQILLSGGSPGKRWALSRASVVLSLPQGPPEPTRRERAALGRCIDEVVRLIAADTEQDIARVRADLEQERSFNAAEAVEYGFIDGIRDSPQSGGG